MTVIGLVHLTPAINSQSLTQTLGTTLLSHISDTYPTETSQTYHVDHRLFISTSSLLPGSNSKRTFTHLFTSSHSPQRTFIGTTAATFPSIGSTDTIPDENKSELSIITVPTATSLEPFTLLLIQKLGTQWTARQSLVLENGSSVVLPVKDNAKWKISVGDLRLAQARVAGSTVGAQFRGALVEVQYQADNDSDVDLQKQDNRTKYETLFRGLLKGLFRNIKLDLKLEDAKIHLTQLPKEEVLHNGTSHPVRLQETKHEKPPGYQTAELYMEALRGPRG